LEPAPTSSHSPARMHTPILIRTGLALATALAPQAALQLAVHPDQSADPLEDRKWGALDAVLHPKIRVGLLDYHFLAGVLLVVLALHRVGNIPDRPGLPVLQSRLQLA
jgi:hypothetical protein